MVLNNACAALLIVAPLALGFTLARWPKRLRIDSKSRATPPSAVFGTVWASVYIVLGVLLYRLVLPFTNGQHITGWRIGTLAVLVLHLLLAFAWTPLYVKGSPRLALYAIGLVLASGLVLQMMLINHDQLFAVLLAPYIAWLIFALHLNYEAATTTSTTALSPSSSF
jgi:benzodiazapine receptor